MKRLRQIWRDGVDWLASPSVAQGVGSWWMRLHGRGGRQTGSVDLRSLRHVLVVRYDGLGDLVVTTAFLRDLRQALPGVRLTVLVRDEWVDLLKQCPHVDQVLGFLLPVYPRFTPVRRVLAVAAFCRRILWPLRLDAVLVAQSHFAYFDARLFALFSGAPVRLGRRAPGVAGGSKGTANSEAEREWGVLTRVDMDPPVGHEVELLGIWLQRLGLTDPGGDRRLEVHWDAAAARAAGQRLGTRSGTRVRVALGIGASQGPKVWPLERFIEIGRRFLNQGAQVVLIGAGDLQRPAEQVATTLGSAVLNLVGPARLQETAAVLAGCDLFVGNDSGPMHLAAAVGIPVVEVVGWPADVPPEIPGTPLRIGPHCRHRRIVQPEGNGRDWTVRVGEVTVEAVWEAAQSLLRETASAGTLPGDR